MISCTEFIPAYSELFRFIEQQSGEEGVNDFWNYLSDNYLGNLKENVEKHGIRGCFFYWSHSLNEEAADFTMELDEDEGEFSITMHHCPSKGMLNSIPHIEAYHNYCGHCDVLYRRVLAPLGYDCRLDMSEVGQAKCSLRVKKL